MSVQQLFSQDWVHFRKKENGKGKHFVYVFATTEPHCIKFIGWKVWLYRRHNAKQRLLIDNYDKRFWHGSSYSEKFSTATECAQQKSTHKKRFSFCLRNDSLTAFNRIRDKGSKTASTDLHHLVSRSCSCVRLCRHHEKNEGSVIPHLCAYCG